MAGPYRNQRSVDARSALAMCCAALGMAIVFGASWQLLGDLGGRILVRRLRPALVMGWLLLQLVTRLRFGHHRLTVLLACSSVLLFSAVGLWGNYRRVRTEMIHDLEDGLQFSMSMGADVDELLAERDARIEKLTPRWYLRRLVGYEGAALDGASRTFGPTGGIAIFALELIGACFVACYFPAGKASEPVCRECGAWSVERPLLRAGFGHTDALEAALLAGVRDEIEGALPAIDTEEFLELSLAVCPHGHDQVAATLRARDHYLDRRSRQLRMRHRFDLSLSEEEQSLLEARAEELGRG